MHIGWTVFSNKPSTQISIQYLPFSTQPPQLKIADFCVSRVIYVAITYLLLKIKRCNEMTLLYLANNCRFQNDVIICRSHVHRSGTWI